MSSLEPSPESAAQPTDQPAVAHPHLDLTLQHSLGTALTLELVFRLTQPWSVLFAPSGAGKTTILRAIAGLFAPTRARIALHSPTQHETILTDTATGVFLPPHLRGVRMVAQQPALFPHLTVLQNILYGHQPPASNPNDLRTPAQNNPTAQSDPTASLIALCRVAHLTEKMPSALSGGEQQRVALARTLAATGPGSLLLLDEPFTGLEADLRDAIISELRAWLAQRHIPALSVTHDVAEAFQLNAEVLKIASGRVVAQGPAAQVLHAERARLLTQLNPA